MIKIQVSSLSVSRRTSARTQTHTPCPRLHHKSTALLSEPFDPRPRVLSVVPLSEFQRFWDNSNISRHILGPLRRQWRRWKMPPLPLSLHCPYSLIRPSLWLVLPPWCVVFSLGKCRPKWLLCAEAQTTGTQRGAAGDLCASRWPHSG